MDLAVDSASYNSTAQSPEIAPAVPSAGDTSGLFIPETIPANEYVPAETAGSTEAVPAFGDDAYDAVPAETADSIAFTLPSAAEPVADPVVHDNPAPAPQEELPIWAAPIQSDEPFVDSIPAAEPINPQVEAKEAHVLDMLHGNAYNLVGNEAAAPTVAGELAMPHKMHGRKFGYAEPVDSYGVVSFGENTTYFLAFDNSESDYDNYSLGLLTLGLATQSFGLSFEIALGKYWYYEDNDLTTASSTQKYTDPGNQYGATISTSVWDLDLAAHVTYATPSGSYFISQDGAESELDAWNLAADLTLANPNGSLFAWSFKLHFLRSHASLFKKTQTTYEYNGKTYLSTYSSTETDTTSCIQLVPEINIGSAILKNEKARIFLGLNAAVPFIAYDRIKDVVSRHNEYGLTFTPNVLAEVSFNKYLMAFGSVNYQWNALQYRDSYIQSISVESVNTESGNTNAILGIRFQYEFAALEMAFTKQFLQNPFGSFSDHETVAMSVGAFVNF